jgi:biotin operon repressor/predicted small lipoprotein YifL
LEEKMKKVLLAALALTLFLALMTGCGGKSGSIDIDTSPPDNEPDVVVDAGKSMNEPNAENLKGSEGWPASDLPQDFPVYPNGVVDYFDGEIDDLGVFIMVTGTDKATYEAYMKTLKSAGWEIDEDDDPALGTMLVYKTFWLTVDFEQPDIASILLSDMGDLSGYYEWPEIQAFDLPEYPDGKISYCSLKDDGGVSISIKNTSKAAVEKYIQTLEKSGWTITHTFDEEGYYELCIFMDYKKDGWRAGIDFNKDGWANIFVYMPDDEE